MTTHPAASALAGVRQRTRTLKVSEIFGGAFQGEGPAAGERCMFLRLANCNLDCGVGPGATWACDTPYTWQWGKYDRSAEITQMTTDECADRLEEVRDGEGLLVISGGEPLLQRDALVELLDLLPPYVAVDFETNGTRPPLPSDRVRRYMVSPKLANSGVQSWVREVPSALRALEESGIAEFKFVVAERSDLDEVDGFVERHQLSKVWIMPAGTSAQEVLTTGRYLATSVAEHGYNLTLRTHVLLFGDVRGT